MLHAVAERFLQTAFQSCINCNWARLQPQAHREQEFSCLQGFHQLPDLAEFIQRDDGEKK